jgi:hypothetical protein
VVPRRLRTCTLQGPSIGRMSIRRNNRGIPHSRRWFWEGESRLQAVTPAGILAGQNKRQRGR